MRKITVLAIGTDVGKTHVSAQLLGYLRSQGHTVAACKPVMSGFGEDKLADSDAGRLLIACGIEPDREAVDDICLYRFEAALAPNVAAERSGVELDDDRLLNFIHVRSESEADFWLLEGAGGVLSPITDLILNVDVARFLDVPVVLVAANYLGAISHTLSAIEACKSRGLDVLAIAISQPTPDFGGPEEMAGELRKWTTLPLLQVPFSPLDSPGGGIARLAELIGF